MELSINRRWLPARPAFRALLQALMQEITPVHVVGGVVRDVLLGKSDKIKDVDLVIAHSAIPIARRVADKLGWAFYALDEGRDIARIIFTAGAEPLVCDIARMRGGSIDADLRMRDFTVNALAFAVRADDSVEIIDPTGGRADLEAGRIRRVQATSLADDPVRVLRAARFAVALDFPIEEETRLQILRMPEAVLLASAERVRDELWKIMAGVRPAAAIELMRTLGILPYVLPEVAAMDLVGQSAPHDQDVYRHTLAVMNYATRLRDWLLGRKAEGAAHKNSGAHAEDEREARMRMALHALGPWSYYLRQHFSTVLASGNTRAEWLVWDALLHDIGKPATRHLEVEMQRSAEGEEMPVVRTRFFHHEEVGARLARVRLEALRFSRVEVDMACAVVLGHMRPHHLHAAFPDAEISRRARYRFFRDIGARDLDRPPGVDVLMLALADFLGTNARVDERAWRAYLVHITQLLTFHFSERGVEGPALHPLVDGRLLMEELALKPGPLLGKLLDDLQEAQAAGDVSTRVEAIALARRLVAERDSG